MNIDLSLSTQNLAMLAIFLLILAAIAILWLVVGILKSEESQTTKGWKIAGLTVLAILNALIGGGGAHQINVRIQELGQGIHQQIDSFVASQICQVRKRFNSADLKVSLVSLKDLPNSFPNTTRAYAAFLEKPTGPDELEAILNGESSAYTHRLLGLAYDLQATDSPPPDSEEEKRLLKKALDHLQKAYDEMKVLENKKENMPGNPPGPSVARLKRLLRHEIAGTKYALSVQLKQSENRQSDTYLREAESEYSVLIGEGIEEGGAYLNFVLVKTALGKYEDAVSFVRTIDRRKEVTKFEKEFIRHRLFRMKDNPDAKGLLDYVAQQHSMAWKDFVDQSVPGRL